MPCRHSCQDRFSISRGISKQEAKRFAWFHEIEFDGYRMVCRINKGKVQLINRKQQDWTKKLDYLADAAKGLPVSQALLDGEIVALSPDGRPDFQELQHAIRERRADRLHYYVFDLLHLDGPADEQIVVGGCGASTSPLESNTTAVRAGLWGEGPASRLTACPYQGLPYPPTSRRQFPQWD